MRWQKPYKAAVIGRTGKGDYGHGLDVAWRDQPGVELVAVADENETGRAAAAKRLRVDRAYADYREMLEKERPAFVSVAPRWLDPHRDMIEACAEYGVRGVFCEKPLAPTLADCDAIVAACERSHMQVAIAFQTRYSPIYDQVKKLIADGAIGDVLELRGRGKEDHRGGGEDLMVLGTHVMDLFRGVLGEADWCFARVSENGVPVGKAQVRDGAEGIGPLAGDRVDAMYGFRGTGAVAHFATSRPGVPETRFGLQILGSKGLIVMASGWLPATFLLDDPTWFTTGNGRLTPITSQGAGKPETLPPGDAGVANRLIVQDLIRAVETDSPTRVTVQDGRASIEMILAAYASHAAGRAVPLPLEDRSAHPLLRLS